MSELMRKGLWTEETAQQAEAVLAALAAGNVETVRVLFVDQHGILRGKTLVAGALKSVFASGVAVPSTLLLKDTSHRTVYPVWSPDSAISSGSMRGASDVLLVPDPTSFQVLPWAPHSAWMFCDVLFRDGNPIPFASQAVLRRAINQLAEHDMYATMGLEVEFHIFQRVEASLDHDQTTMPGQPPQTRALTHGYQFLTETRYGEAEPILDRLRRHAQAIGLPVRSVEIEMGPSQFEFTFEPGDPMTQAQNMVMFRTLVKEVCGAEGLHASFMAKPRLPNIAANGWHIHQSICDGDGRNLFIPTNPDQPTPQASGWIAGLLAHAEASSLLTVPTVNGYKRFQPYQLAPDRIAWGQDNRGAMVRALMVPGDTASRVENRAPDTTANPYYAFAAQLVSGLDGIVSNRVAPPATESPYDSDVAVLPTDLAAAIDAFDASSLYRKTLGDEFVDYIVKIKRFEWDRYLASVSEWEQAEYFNLF